MELQQASVKCNTPTYGKQKFDIDALVFCQVWLFSCKDIDL